MGSKVHDSACTESGNQMWEIPSCKFARYLLPWLWHGGRSVKP